jgi:cyclophilin family peptidyl-prolyl cis-trans isomerase/HEAT repeat protein
MLIRLESLRVDPADLAPFVVDTDPEVRARAALSLARVNDPRGAGPLSSLLNDDNADVRMAAAHGLGQIEGMRKSLVRRLANESDSEVRAEILRALGMQGNAWDIDLLLDTMQQPIDDRHDSAEIAAAANALGQMAVRGINTVRINRVVKALVRKAESNQRDIRFNAAFALARIAPSTGPDGVESMLTQAAIDEHDATIKALLIRACSDLPTVDAVLRETVKHPTPSVRIATARSSVNAAWPGVVALLADDVPSVSLAAIEAVGRIPSLARVELLGPIVKRGMDLNGPTADGERLDPALAKAIAALLALDLPRIWWETDTARYTRVQAGLLPSLSMYMSEDRDTLVRAAATAIAADPANLYRLATSDPSGMVRMAAAQRILSDGISYGRAMSLLNAKDTTVQAAVADWLRDHPNPKAEAALLALASQNDDTALVYSAVMALASMTYRKAARKRGTGGPAALLPSLLGHQDPAIRAAGLELAKATGTWPQFFEHSPEPVDAVAIGEIRSATIATAHGEMVVQLFPDRAPLTVANFARLADAGFYDGLPYHRVIPDFVAQGGDPRGDGWGGPGHTIPDEVSATRYEAGTVGMALNGDDTGGSQWFVALAPQPHLNGRYTAFGKVVSGLNVAKSLLPGDRIENVSIERVMNSEDRHAEGLERAELLLAKLQANQAAPARATNPKRKTKKKKSRKGEQDTAPKEADTRNETRDDPPETTEPSDDKLPDEFEKGEEEDPLLEGEKVEVIDPNEE